jgi:ADP-ribose pyrophosphatase YjhB (NUDIX family)
VSNANTTSRPAEVELVAPIRPTARAIIVRQGRILLLRKDYGEQGERYTLPGGGQEPGETLHQALQRECEEEIGTPVQIGPMLHAADFFKLKATEPPTRRHLLELLFRCEVPDHYRPRNGPHPDKHQVAVLWVDIASLTHLPMSPAYLRECILRLDAAGPVYLGKG